MVQSLVPACGSPPEGARPAGSSLGRPEAVEGSDRNADATRPSAITTRRPPEPMRVIVAEDDADGGEVLGDIVRRLGHFCEVACDGSAAWDMHHRKRADLIISDWKMPVMDGLQLCREVRESDPPHWHTHFILITGRNDRHLVEGLHAGADEYIAKPLDHAELEARLHAAWRTVVARRELEARNSALQVDSARYYEAARTDPLTAISNRLRLKEDLEPLEGRVSRYGHRYCAALCDVDRFKAYNDSFGHLAGDDALCLIARAIQEHLRTGDTLYRYGGEEFLVILPEQSLSDAQAGMGRVRHEVEKLCIRHAAVVPGPFVTLSVGIADLGRGTVDDWLRRADAALYRAKSLGRNRVEVEDPAPGPPTLPFVARPH
jgi:two-component system cell cycle response regulator